MSESFIVGFNNDTFSYTTFHKLNTSPTAEFRGWYVNPSTPIFFYCSGPLSSQWYLFINSFSLTPPKIPFNMAYLVFLLFSSFIYGIFLQNQDSLKNVILLRLRLLRKWHLYRLWLHLQLLLIPQSWTTQNNEKNLNQHSPYLTR